MSESGLAVNPCNSCLVLAQFWRYRNYFVRVCVVDELQDYFSHANMTHKNASFIHFSIDSLIEDLVSIYCVPGTISRAGEALINETGKCRLLVWSS